MLVGESDSFPLYLLPQHVVGRNKSLLPTSFLEAQEQLVRLTDAGLRVSCPSGLRMLSDSDFEYPASFDGSCISVNIEEKTLDLPVQFASVITAVENNNRTAYVGIQQYQKRNMCWLFAVKDVERSLPKVVQQLAAASAILSDVLPMPENVRHLSAGRTQVFSSRRVALVREETRDHPILSINSRSYSSTSGISNELLQLAAQMEGGFGGNPRPEQPSESHRESDTPLEKGDTKEDEPEEAEETHWVTKFYQQTGAPANEEDSFDDPFVLPGGAVSSPSSYDDAAPMPGDEVLKELKILTLVQGSKHVLNMFGVFQMPDPTTRIPNWTLISEYCSGCSMTAYLKAHGKLSELDAKKATYGLLAALVFLHHRSVVHRDVKLDHLLLRGHDNELVLCGFGSACFLGEIDEGSCEVGTLGYQAPEILQHNIIREPADVFAAGVVIFCVLTRKKPFGGSTPAELTKHSTIHKEVDFSRHKVFETTSDECKQLIQQLLEKSQARRLTADQALHHQWLLEVAPAAAPQMSSESTARASADPSESTGARHLRSVSPKRTAAPANGNVLDELSTHRHRSSAQGSSRRSRSLMQTFRERTGNLLPSFPFRSSLVRQRGEAVENLSPISPAQHRDAPPEGSGQHRSSMRRGLSMIRSMIPSRRSTADGGSLEHRPFNSLDAD